MPDSLTTWAERIEGFRVYERFLLKPTRVYCKRRMTDAAVRDPEFRCKYMTYVSVAAETFKNIINNHPRRQFDLSNLSDLEELYYSASYEDGPTSVLRGILLFGCMELVRENCYEDKS